MEIADLNPISRLRPGGRLMGATVLPGHDVDTLYDAHGIPIGMRVVVTPTLQHVGTSRGHWATSLFRRLPSHGSDISL